MKWANFSCIAGRRWPKGPGVETEFLLGMAALLPFAFASLMPVGFLGLAGAFGGIWPLASFISISLLVIFLDRLTGDDWAPPQIATGHVLSIAVGLVHFAVLAGFIWAMAVADHLNLLDRILIFLSTGLWFGQVSNSNAHELIHRSAKWPRRLGIAIYCSLLFGHHASAHPKVHHVYVATDRDPNSAPFGEGFYRFLARAWGGGFSAGLQAENMIRARTARVLPIWQHPYFGYISGSILTIFVAGVIANVSGLLALVAIGLIAQLQLFLSDYVQHYGLRRRLDEDGRPEPVGPQHSWNAPHWYSSALMMNAPRHSDHHQHPSRNFPALELAEDKMPILPFALPVMAFIALIPALWHVIMDPHVRKWKR